MNFDINLSKNLKTLRESKGYSLDYVAKLIGKHRSTIHLYETGKISITINVLKDILEIYGISAGKFLDEIES